MFGPPDTVFEDLYFAKRSTVRAKILRILTSSGNRSATEDVCQQFWAHLWKVGPQYWNGKGVNLISKQICFKWLRKHKSPPMVQILDRIDSEDWQEPQCQQSELVPDVSKVQTLLLNLPGEQRAVFAFRYQLDGHEELTFSEIGRRMGISTSCAAHLFYLARKNLKNMLEQRL